MARLVLAVVVVVLVGCTPPDPTVGTRLLHDFDSEGFWDAPFPSEHRRHPDGTVDVAGFPRIEAPTPFVDKVVALADGNLGGFGTTSAIYFRTDAPMSPVLPDAFATAADAPVMLLGVDRGGADFGVRVPVDVVWAADGGPFGASSFLSLLPLQGRPLHPETTYAAVVLRELRDGSGELLAHHPVLSDLLAGDVPPGMSADAAEAYREALGVLGEDLEIEPTDIAGLAVFETQDPRAELMSFLQVAREQPTPSPLSDWVLADVFDGYCVYGTTVEMPVFQAGEAPFLTSGGAWEIGPDGPVLQGVEEARLIATIPRATAPAGGWPTAVFIRTGGGGDRPLVDRGPRPEPGVPGEPGEGPARQLAAAGWAGVSVDGPLGGLRNVTGGDEQFLIFNVSNPAAMRDNVRQSGMELALVPDLLQGLQVDTADCPGADDEVTFDVSRLALVGHSMGATIAPLTMAAEPAYRVLVLSGAGGSWVQNVVHKQSPLEVRPIAEAMLQYPDAGHSLDEHDPVLALLQWAGESSDPPVYGRAFGAAADDPASVLMVQGIVDTYILPPIANATSLSLGLGMGGDLLDAGHPDLGIYRSVAEVMPLAEHPGDVLALPAASTQAGATAVVVQHAEDGIEDGHEAFFQSAQAQGQFECFMRSWLNGSAVVVQPEVGCP